MIESMTGFATVEHAEEGLHLAVRIKAVNSRFLDTRLRLPTSLAALEPRVIERVKGRVARGKVEIDVEILSGGVQTSTWHADTRLARDVTAAVEQLQADTGIEGTLDLPLLIQIAGSQLLRHVGLPEGLSRAGEIVANAVDAALERLCEERAREGEALSRDLGDGVAALRTLIDDVDAQVPEMQSVLRERILTRLEALSAAPRTQDESRRIEQEIVLLADRSDVHEELVRLRTHLESFDATRLDDESPCGKRLDFLLQEVLREVNTVGAKVPLASVRSVVVDMKVLVEKLRQQVANVA